MSLNDPDFPVQFLVSRELATRQNVDTATATRVAAVGSMLASGVLAPIVARQLAIREAPATKPVSAPAPALLSLAPNTGAQGQVLDVTITGQNTNFTNASVISAGDGIIVKTIAADSRTQLRATLEIAAGAVAGSRSLKVTTGFEAVSLANAFTVTATPTLALIIPNTAQPRDTVQLSILGRDTHFTDASVIDLGSGISVTDVVALNSTQLFARASIDASAAAGVRSLKVTTGNEVVVRTDAFTVSGRPTVSISPSTGAAGEIVKVEINGQNTHFTAATTISLEEGILAGNITAPTATQIKAELTIAADAAPGPRCITITSGAEEVHLAGAFTVTAPQIPQPLQLSEPSTVNQQLLEIATKVEQFVKAQETQERQDREAAAALNAKADRQKAERTEALEKLCHALGSFGGQSALGPSKIPQSQSGPQAQAQGQTSSQEQQPPSQGRKGESKP